LELVYKALELNPSDMKGLELAAINAFQDKNYAQAAYYFKHLLKQVPPDSPYAKDIEGALKEAKQMAESPTGKLDNLSDPGASAGKEAAAPGASIKGKLDIAAALKGKVNAGDVVFLFAKSGPGGPPAAALRSMAGKLPMEFELTDDMAMNADNKLSKYKEVTLTARISKSGQPMGGPGDLEGTLTGVKVGANGIKLTIDKVRQ
jgi:cytochrome c-type biogenesis protein CcmH